MNGLKTSGLGPAAAVFLVLVAVRPASAHALGAECRLRGDRVEVEAYYDDDTPARDARVTVQDATKKNVAEGRTDDKGFWSFPRPEPGRYRVTVDAGAGHRTTVTITVPSAQPDDTAAAGALTGECDCCKDSTATGDEQTVVKLSEGPGREEFTRPPWLKISLGLVVIAGFALTAWWVLRLRRPGVRHPAARALDSEGGIAGSSPSA
jgi:nickel transport protein